MKSVVERNVIKDIHIYLKFTRFFGVFPCNTSGLSKKWRAYSIISQTCIYIPVPLAMIIFLLYSGYVVVEMLPSCFVFISRTLVPIVHSWQLHRGKHAREIMMSLVQDGPYPYSWQFEIGTILAWSAVICSERKHLLFGSLQVIISPEIATTMILMQFCSCAERMIHKFSTLYKYTSSDFRRVLIIEHKLIQQAQRVSDFYAPQLTLACANIFGNAIYHAYGVVAAIPWLKGNSYDEALKIIILKTSGFILSTIFIFVVVRVCHNQQQMVRKCKEKMFQLAMKDPELCKKRYVWSYLLTNQNVKFSACGLFPIGYSFITSLVAATVSFLVMLTQLTSMTMGTSTTKVVAMSPWTENENSTITTIAE